MLVGSAARQFIDKNIISSDRYPFSPFPESWYAVCMEHDINKGDVIPSKVCGQDIVVYRTDSGNIHVVDAYCPHLGAHLGYGGTVEGDAIRCPFHGWAYDCSGTCSDIPEVDKPMKVGLIELPSKTVNGMVMVWWSPEKNAPTWFVDPVDLSGWTAPVLREDCTWILQTHVQEIAENGVDIAHFNTVHGANKVGVIDYIDYCDAAVKWRSISEITTGTSVVESVTDVQLYGLGLQQVYAESSNKLPSGRTFLHSTPIDESSICIRLAVSIESCDNADKDEKMLGFIISKLAKELSKDFDIWERKKYISRPPLSSADGPIRKFRQWAKQFYKS